MKKIIILFSFTVAIIFGCKKSSSTTPNANNCTANKTCTVEFTNDYSSALDITVYDANNVARVTITGLASGAKTTKDNIPSGDVIVRWSGGTLSGTLSHFYTYESCKTYTDKYYTTLPSDFRYKKDIGIITGDYALENIMQLKPSSYKYDFKRFPALNAVSGRTNGFIAQDIEKIFPEVVIKDANGYRSVNYAAMIPVLTAAIQEQQQQIKTLQRQLKQLNHKN